MDTLQEYLIKLGFKVDENGWKGFNEKVINSGKNVAKLGAGTVAVAAEIGIMVEKVARHYEELYYVSQRSGATISSLKAQEFGFRQIGLTAEQSRSAVENFSAAMRTNPGVRAMFQGMGVDTSDAKKATEQLVGNLKARFGESNYFVAQQYAAMGGIDELTFKQMWDNGEKLAAQEADHVRRQKEAGIDAEKYGRDSVKFNDSLRRAQDEWGLLIDRVAADWLPVAQKTVDGMEAIAEWIAKANDASSGWLGTIGSIVAALGVLKTTGAALGVAGRLLGIGGASGAATGASLGLGRAALARFGPVGAVAAVMYPVPANANESPLGGAPAAGDSSPEAQAWRAKNGGGSKDAAVRFFMNNGWSREQAAGIVSNLHAESGLRADNVGDGGAAYGVAQWHPDRQADFARWAGKSIRDSSLEEQLAFVQYELTQGKEKLAGNALRGQTTASGAGSVVSRMYERPKAVDEAAFNRGVGADTILASGAGAGTSVTISHKTENNITGVSDPKKAAGMIDDSQQRVNGDIVRNTRSAFN